MTRLLWWLPEYPPDPGGIATFASHVAPALAESGHDITMLVTYGAADDRYLADRLRIRRESFRKALENMDARSTLQLQRRTREIKIESSAELYHIHLCEPSPFLHVATIGTVPAPTIVTLHNEELPGFEPDNPDTLLHRLFTLSSVITCVSAATTRRFAKLAPRFSHRLITIPNGAPVSGVIVPLPSAPHIVGVGRLAHQKGFDRLLRAMPLVIEAIPDVHLDLVGDGPEGSTLADAIERLGIDGHVTMHGHVSRDAVIEYVRRSRFLVAPSRFEGLPYAALEAAGNARAIVATRVAGTEDIVEHGITGILIDNDGADDDPTALATAIIELLRDPARATTMGIAGRSRTERLFSLDSCVDAFHTTYKSVLEPVHDVAIIIPVRNGERHLAAAIDSALAEIDVSSIDAQVVVVDDGSTDGSATIAQRYADRGVVLFSQPSLGPGIARNAGIALSRSTWVAHLDADDLWPAGRLRRLLDAADDDTEAVFGCAVEFADDDAPANVRIEFNPRPVRMGGAGLIRRSAYERIGGFQADPSSDMVEWSSRAFAADLRYVQIEFVVLERRIHATNMSHGRPFSTDTTRIALLKDHLARRRSTNSD